MLKYINEVNGAAYLLDCYPNLGKFTVEEKTRRTIEAVRAIRAYHAAPIVIVQHTGFNQDEIQASTRTQVAEANEAAQKAKNVDSQAHPEVAPEGTASFPQDPYLQLRLAEQAVFGSAPDVFPDTRAESMQSTGCSFHRAHGKQRLHRYG